MVVHPPMLRETVAIFGNTGVRYQFRLLFFVVGLVAVEVSVPLGFSRVGGETVKVFGGIEAIPDVVVEREAPQGSFLW